MVARRAEPFDRSGFPKPVAPPRRVYGMQDLTMAACIAVAAAIVLGTGTVLILNALHHKDSPTASAATVGPAVATQPPLSANSHQEGVTPSPARPGNSGGGKQHIGLTITVSGSPSATPPLQGQGSAPGPGSGPGSSSPTPGRTQPAPTPSPSQTSPPPSPGTLSVSPGSVTLAGVGSTASVTLTASGGTVSYSIDNPAAGDLAVSPSSGSLSAGQSVTVSVTVVSDAGLASETDLTANPGGLTIAALYSAAG
jgi:hypothetical protein